jgi:CHAT domain-containing protein/tetratricopeptide (TPR) repeat protein
MSCQHRPHVDFVGLRARCLTDIRIVALAGVVVCTSSAGISGTAAREPFPEQVSAAQVSAEPVGAEPVGAQQAGEWLRSADQSLRDENYGDALPLFERTLDEAQRLGLEEQQAQAHCGLGEIQFERGRYTPAREHAERAAAIYGRLTAETEPARRAIDRGRGRANHLLARVAEREGNLPGAQEYAERAIAAYDAAGDRRGRGLARLQALRTAPIGLEEERRLNDQVIADARAVSDRVLEGSALHSFGDELFSRGHYAEALVKLEASAALFEATGRQTSLGAVYNSLGRVYRAHWRLDAALASQLKALALHEKSNSPFNHLQSLNAVAVTYQSLGDFRRARSYFERALALADQTTPRIQDFLRANFASFLLDLGDSRQAADVLEGVVARGLDRFPTTRMRDLADAYLRLGRPDVALVWADKSFAACGGRETLPCIHALDRRAEAHAALGDDVAALADLREAMTMMESVRARLVAADFLKQQFHLAQEDLYSRAIALEVRRHQDAVALETAERGRARAFVDLLASRDLTIAAAGERADGGTSVTADTAPFPARSLPLVFRGASASTQAGSADLPSDAVVPAASSAQLVATAARLQSTLVSYWVTRNQMFIWVITSDGGVRSYQVDVRLSKLTELIRTTMPFGEGDQGGGAERRQAPPKSLGTLTTRGAESIAVQLPASPAWRELYDLLVRPVRGALPRTSAGQRGALLTIIPHGPLGALAFAGLQDERGRYLLEDYAIHYAPSGAALQYTAGRQRKDARNGSLLMISDPVPPALSRLDRPLPRLPGARAEGRAVAALIPRARLTRFEGAGASESSVLRASAGKAVLHFATHAIVRGDEPLSSFLALAAAGDDDGRLTAQEIYRLRLDADLVVLSACRSAGGRVTGDGIATFARAFIYAGAPSIVASVWDVADEPTNRLLPAFYRAWLGGASKARALRTAQLGLMHDLRAGKVHIVTPAGQVSLPEHPVFWAGFSLLGEP